MAVQDLVPSKALLPLLIIEAATEQSPALEGRTKLTKLVFLAEKMVPNEVRTLTGSPEPYTFEPHNYGPFSAELLGDLDLLKERGLIIVTSRPLDSRGHVKEYIYSVTPQGARVANAEALGGAETGRPQAAFSGIRRLANVYGSLDRQHLVDFVYKNYPNALKS